MPHDSQTKKREKGEAIEWFVPSYFQRMCIRVKKKEKFWFKDSSAFDSWGVVPSWALHVAGNRFKGKL